ncbi:hypothetical protein JYU34_012681 [Plutella xylostella]|uniref:Endonuclease III homolog n=1 Tax=Plutella xylostella TaxID=51655 RepID=A0ABQ7QBX3_PLUXY|nr:hypothetical protein JYU34_012681 [Plutella xylostella]
MPRNKVNPATIAEPLRKSTRNKVEFPQNNVKDERDTEESHNLLIKQEPVESLLDTTPPKFSEFKYEKKTHVKIEYEKESPKKEDGGLWEPPHWRNFLLNLRNMRANKDAPVDTMGCHKAMDEEASPQVMRYQSLLALMLSSQTKDQVTFAAMERLKARGCTVDNILQLSDEELGKLIYPVGFWKTKVKYIKKTTQTLKEQYNGDIPDSVEKLCKLTGVGPKMAHICMQVAWNKTTGIGVDTHVHRISNRIGWVKKPTATPEDTRKALESWLPFDLWSEVNHLMVGFGQTICQPISPICNECLNNDICPSRGIGRKSPNKSPKKTPSKQEPKHESDDDFDMKIDNKLNIPKKAPKRKITPAKTILNDKIETNVEKVKLNKSPKIKENIVKIEDPIKVETKKVTQRKGIPKKVTPQETAASCELENQLLPDSTKTTSKRKPQKTK